MPAPADVDVLLLGPGERIDCYVAMNAPGVWILGAPQDYIRNGGMGLIVEYANQNQQPQWIAPAKHSWGYTRFGRPTAAALPEHLVDMVFEKLPRGAGKFNTFTTAWRSCSPRARATGWSSTTAPMAAARRRPQRRGRPLPGIEASALSDQRERPESGVE